MSAFLISAELFERMAYDKGLTIELAKDRAFAEHEGVTYCALLGMTP